MGSSTMHKACDTCRARKIRCRPLAESACEFCIAKRLQCTFSPVKRPRKRRLDHLSAGQPRLFSTTESLSSNPGGHSPQIDLTLPTPTTQPSYVWQSTNIDRGFSTSDPPLAPARHASPSSANAGAIEQPRLYMDFLLENRQASQTCKADNHADQLTTILGPNPNISFFPANRVRSISQRLRNCRLEQLLDTIRDVLAAKIKSSNAVSETNLLRERRRDSDCSPGEPSYEKMKSYIETYLHAVHPLCPFLCPGSFKRSVEALDLERNLATDKPWAALYYAVVAIGCQYNDGGSFEPGQGEAWFYFAKSTSFYQDIILSKACLTSVQMLQDCFVSCPVPVIKESTFEDYDWFFSFLKFARIQSKIHSSLFTVSPVPKQSVAHSAAIPNLRKEVEAWRMSIPLRFRPGEPLKPRMLPEPLAIQVALLTHYYYLNAVLTLSWALLHGGNDTLSIREQLELKKELMRTARTVIELTAFIEVSPSTPVWILAVMPLSALMILFDLVIHNPQHPETNLSLALLDIASGHFSRIEVASKAVLPGSLIAEFAHLARQYVSDTRGARDRQGAGATAEQQSTEAATNASFEPCHPTSTSGKTYSTNVGGPGRSSRTNTLTYSQAQVLQSQPEPVLPFMQAVKDNSIHPPGQMEGTSSDEQHSLYFPMTDDPNYQLGDLGNLGMLGVDLMHLFDTGYPFVGDEGSPVI
ncbi:uncharacterized protein CDV56_105302 [Aspergillus thermomutatus]|uniref:Zn(2)-C6 fungal-type domain-containing protein n=1 Tax=Aspergillus thermomutatus TaxID=41047 RepID=A0A397H8L5_ASPTH|nr:uncharacterized protein CDV56_105302 [Aspergillus thermomutatus]RHZ57996.1 hypothetical protein CDV56_105302 [Aspergillus thermomutatus]